MQTPFLLMCLWQTPNHAASVGEDWPCWRGPERSGVSAETDWLSESADEPLWTRAVGLGHSSVAVVDERLYTLGFDEAKQQDVLWCLDAETGALLWSARTPAEKMANGHGGGTLTTPAVAGDAVFVTSRRGVVRCLAVADGTTRWTRDLIAEHDAQPTDYGFGGSPVIEGELVLANANRTFALDRESGATKWMSQAHRAMYSTPQPAEIRGAPGAFVFSKEGLIALELEQGTELGRFPWQKGRTSVNASTPVLCGDGRVFLSSAYGHGGALIDFSGEAPVALWETRSLQTQLSGCVLVDGHLFGFDETKLKCFGLDGKEKWRKRGFGMGALMAADGRLIVLTAQGELAIVSATPDKYVELSLSKVVLPGSNWASPVLAGGRIFCRTGTGQLVALDHRAPANE